MKKVIVTILMTAWVFAGFSQNGCKIKKAYAYYSVSTPGVQMVDINGNPVPVKPNITRFIYIEWTGANAPEIETVLYNNVAMNITLNAEEGNKAVLGPNYTNNPDFNVTAKKCNSLWKLGLYPADAGVTSELNCTDIVIKTKGAANGCKFKVSKETVLMTMPRY